VLSTTADHALRALLVLANFGAGRPLPAETLAGLTGAPANYLAKTLNQLTRAGLLTSTRGPNGGFALAIPPEAISIASIADVFAEPVAESRCLLGTGACDANRPCTAHDVWNRVQQSAREPLIQTTLANLLSTQGIGHSESPDLAVPASSY
jgi:Rrf2 family protein